MSDYHINVFYSQEDGGYRVEIRDDGVGFTPPQLLSSAPGHLGLSSMRERAEMAGGWCKVHSLPGGGTTVEFWVPPGQASAEEVGRDDQSDESSNIASLRALA